MQYAVSKGQKKFMADLKQVHRADTKELVEVEL